MKIELTKVRKVRLPGLFLFIWLVSGLVTANPGFAQQVKRGEYIFRASGGCSCHTVPNSNNQYLAGGRALKTPFGAIYSTNITPDKETGIGTWTEADFIKSMTKGVRKDGAHLFPVFPYTSFTKITTGDLKDLYAFMKTIKPVPMENKDDELFFLFKWRFGLLFWKLLNFKEGSFEADSAKSDIWNRGAYLSEALAHCSECHTPRDISGGLKNKLLFSGSVEGPEGEPAPNITPDPQTGVGDWEKDAMTWFLQTGQKPDGDYTGGLMSEVINEGYQYLSNKDLEAITEFIFSLDPVHSELKKE